MRYIKYINKGFDLIGDPDRSLILRLGNAVKNLKDPNAFLTIAENFAVTTKFRKRNLQYFGMTFEHMAANPKLFESLLCTGATEKLLLSAVYQYSHRYRTDDGKIIYYPKILEDTVMPLAAKFFKHSSKFANLEANLRDTEFSLGFMKLHCMENDPVLHYQAMKEYACSPEEFDEGMKDYIINFEDYIARDVYMQRVIKWPHNTILGDREEQLFYKMLSKTYLSREEADKHFLKSMNKAKYGCENVEDIEKSRDIIFSNIKLFCASLLTINDQFQRFYRMPKKPFKYDNPDPEIYRVTRSVEEGVVKRY